MCHETRNQSCLKKKICLKNLYKSKKAPLQEGLILFSGWGKGIEIKLPKKHRNVQLAVLESKNFPGEDPPPPVTNHMIQGSFNNPCGIHTDC